MKRKPTYIILLLLFLVTACSDSLQELLDAEGIRWNPKIAVPLINAEFSFNDLVEEVDTITLVEILPDGLINLIYSSSLETQTATDFFFVPNQSFDQSITVPSVPNLPQGLQTRVESNFEFEFDGFAIEFDSVVLKEGNLELEVETNVAADVRISITLFSLLNNNVPFSAQLASDYSGNKNIRRETLNSDLSGSKFELTSQDDPVSKIAGMIEVQLAGRNEALLETDVLDLSLNISGLEFLRIHGSIPPTAIVQEPDTLSITFFESINSGTFSVSQPEIRFDVQNSFGLPAEISFDGIKVRKLSQDIRLEGPITEQGSPIPAPASISDDPATTSIAVNASNSNLPDMIEILPNEFIYQFRGLLNPDGIPQLFVWDTSKIAVDYDVSVPLEGWVDQMSLTRDYDFDGELLEDVTDVAFRIKTENELPLSLQMQFFFLDASREVIDSLLVDGRQIIDPATVDQNGESSGAALTEKTVAFSEAKTTRITNARFIRVEAEVSSTDVANQTAIKILADDQLSIAIGMQTNVNTEL